MNIAFFGTSDRSIPIIEALDKHFNLSLCVTKTDTIIGRKKTKRETAVKKWAKKHSIDYFEISNLKEETTDELIAQLSYSKVEYGLVADFSMIIPEKLINYFNGNLINIHFSKLPKYRGASPVQFAMLNGDETTGISYQLVHKKLDKGDILGIIEYKIPVDITAGEIYSEMFDVAANHLPKILEDFSKGKISHMPQDDKLATYTYSPTHPKRTTIFKEDAKINWEDSIEKIERATRAYNPWPISWTTVSELESNEKVDFTARADLNKESIIKIYKTKVVGNKLIPEIVQIEGKNKTDWKSFVNGYAKIN